MAQIFVTGIAGFLGSHIAEEMVRDGHAVCGVDNLIGGYSDNVPLGASFTKLDLMDLDGLTRAMEGSDIVYHTACAAYEGLSVFSPSLITQNTLQISVHAMTAAIKAGVKRFIHCSSMARYGTQSVKKYTEDLACNPQDPYGIAKLASEKILANLAETHEIELVIAVPHNIIGPRQKYDDPYRNVAGIMINLMLQGRQPYIYGDGLQTRCFSDVRDDIACLKQMAFSKDAVGEVFNIGPDEEVVTINDICYLIANKLQFNVDPNYVPDRPREVKHAVCSADKIRQHFGYRTKYSLSESIDSMIDYIKMRGARPFEYHLPVEIISEKTPATWSKKLFE